jgi:hypothetical protein
MTHSVVVTEDYRVAGKPRFGVELNGVEVFHNWRNYMESVTEAKEEAEQKATLLRLALGLKELTQ